MSRWHCVPVSLLTVTPDLLIPHYIGRRSGRGPTNSKAMAPHRRGSKLSGVDLTTEAGDGPVAADALGERGKLEDKRAHVGVCIGVRGCDVHPGVGPGPLTHLRLLGNQHWSVVVHVYQVDLQGACSTSWRRTWERKDRRRKTEVRMQYLTKKIFRSEVNFTWRKSFGKGDNEIMTKGQSGEKWEEERNRGR